MEQLKEFMLLFRYEPSNTKPTENEINEMHKHWGNFIGNVAMQGKLVSTHQLGFEGVQIYSNSTTNDKIYISDKQTLSGNMILKAIQLDEAVEIAKKCPILHMGGFVEVRSINPM